MTATRGPALGVLEVSTIARGVVTADAGLKRAPAVLLHSRAVSGGKHLVFFEGGVAEVEEAMGAGRLIAGDQLLDRVELPAADFQVWLMLGAPIEPLDWSADAGAEAVAIIETKTVCAAIAAADAACKVADVLVRDTRFAVDLAGKAYFTLTGTLDAIEAAAIAATSAANDRLVGLEVIAQPAPDLRGRLFR
ncbi:MAG TPA: BMC domain-containing protein [Kofleriaceae bacterium]|nr:BMC domain-containing protein [Kofleriaceae bacterium]